MVPLAQALHWLQAHIVLPTPRAVPRREALYRTLAAPAPLHLSPPHPVAAIAGHAVRAAATLGASDYLPLSLASSPVQAGDQVPLGTDAVLPPSQFERGRATAQLAPGENVIPPGQDSGRGTLPSGAHLHPLHLPLLAADPVIHPLLRIILHRPSPLLEALFAGIASAGIASAGIASAGIASAGIASADEERTPGLILTSVPPPPGAPIPAIAIHPGEPTALGHLDAASPEHTPTIFLPGLAQDCAAAFDLLVCPILRHVSRLPPPPTLRATLSRKITSPLGITSAVRLSLHGAVATPLHAGLQAAAAEALTVISDTSEGYPEGATIPISLLR